MRKRGRPKKLSIKVQFQNRIDAEIVEEWNEIIPKGEKVENLEIALKAHLKKFKKQLSINLPSKDTEG
jgi:hypothetical protein